MKAEERRLKQITRDRTARVNSLEAKVKAAGVRVALDTVQAARVDALIDTLFGTFVSNPETNVVEVCSDSRFVYEMKVLEIIEAQVDVVAQNRPSPLVVPRPNVGAL